MQGVNGICQHCQHCQRGPVRLGWARETLGNGIGGGPILWLRQQ
jgi:hypothetical protein